MQTELRTITAADAAAYQTIRLRALQEHPEAFGADYADECSRSLAAVAERLQDLPERFVLGAWQGDHLRGMVAFHQGQGQKIRHRGGVGGMYVAPEVRGQGIGKALINELIGRARCLPNLEEIVLAVTVGNHVARAMYMAAGFQPAHLEQRYIKLADHYYDIEWMTLRFETSSVGKQS